MERLATIKDRVGGWGPGRKVAISFSFEEGETEAPNIPELDGLGWVLRPGIPLSRGETALVQRLWATAAPCRSLQENAQFGLTRAVPGTRWDLERSRRSEEGIVSAISVTHNRAWWGPDRPEVLNWGDFVPQGSFDSV